MNISQYMITESKELKIRNIDTKIKALQETASEQVEKFGYANDNICAELQKLSEQKEILEEAKHHAVPIDAVKVGKEKETKEDKKEKLANLETSYENKYNGFCLSISKYNINKLENMMDSKKKELKQAKIDKKNANSKAERKEFDMKIDYLTKACHKCGEMIHRRKSFENR